MGHNCLSNHATRRLHHTGSPGISSMPGDVSRSAQHVSAAQKPQACPHKKDEPSGFGERFTAAKLYLSLLGLVSSSILQLQDC